ncbi:MAG: hypothetical protein ACI83N_002060, partial [Hydrogenophaga sp.]
TTTDGCRCTADEQVRIAKDDNGSQAPVHLA